MRKSLTALVIGGLLALGPQAGRAEAPMDVQVKDPYARAVPPGQPNSAAFLTLSNTSAEPKALVAAASPVAATVELHSHIHEDGMMRMRRVERIDIPAGGSVSLEPGGLHLMLIGLKGNLTPGDQVDLTLSFDDGSQSRVLIPVHKIEPMKMTH